MKIDSLDLISLKTSVNFVKALYICLSKMKINMDNRRNFPTNSHYFPKLIEDNAIYVDKTPFIVPLIAKKTNAYYCLSRPRRFGKSLFLSTLEQVFLGK